MSDTADHEEPDFDLVPFGRLITWDGPDGRDGDGSEAGERPASMSSGLVPRAGVEWERPRDAWTVVVGAGKDGEPDAAGPGLRVEYWQSNWPTVQPESVPGPLRGWLPEDDPFHGYWVEARGAWEAGEDGWVFRFDPLDLPELEGFLGPHQLLVGDVGDVDVRDGYRARYRRTLKVRLLGEPGREVSGLRVFSAARLHDMTLTASRVDGASSWHPHVQVLNGYVREVTYPSGGTACVRLLAADAPCGSADTTLVTFRDAGEPAAGGAPAFTVDVTDLRSDPVWIRDLGVYLTAGGAAESFEDYRARTGAAPRQPVYEMVSTVPEQTDDQARREIPSLDIAAHPGRGRYVILGGEGAAFNFGVRYNGEIFSDKALLKLRNRDTRDLGWAGSELRLRIGSGDLPDFRERNDATEQSLEGGYLPIIHSRWQDRGVSYHQECFAAPEQGRPLDLHECRGDERPVLVSTITARNNTTSPQSACIWLQPLPGESLSIDSEGLVVAAGKVAYADHPPRQATIRRYEAPLLRAIVRAVDFPGTALPDIRVAALPGEGTSAATPGCVLVTAMLAPGEQAAVEVKVPFAGNADTRAWKLVEALDATAARREVRDSWETVARAPAGIDCPATERTLEDFTRAVPTHILISSVKDTITGNIIQPAGTLRYGACGNEAIWQVAALDMLGHHTRARVILESLLATQGKIKPDGQFGSAAGALQAVNFDLNAPKSGTFSYNLDHGTILGGLIHHYAITGDKNWLAEIAPNVIAACDFIIRERRGTSGEDARVRGLLPPGHLEDNKEWRYWFAVNAHAYAGMRAAARALTETGHGDAARITREAGQYRDDIRRCVREARISAPVVRLANGVAVPHVPTRARLRGRDTGWIREVGYGPLHLWEAGILADDEPEVAWILQDLEDNLFISTEFGYGIDRDRDWFSLGGLTAQPNLLANGMAYLHRDQVGHSVRAFYNNLRLSLYQDVRCMAEWVSQPGLGGGPFYKAPDEARVLTWLRNHLVLEQAGTLWLGKGVPRSWSRPGQSYGVRSLPTTFGHVTYQVTSQPPDAAEIRAEVSMELRTPPDEVRFRLRHPTGARPATVTVNGQPAEMTDPETVLLSPRREHDHHFQVIARYPHPSSEQPD